MCILVCVRVWICTRTHGIVDWDSRVPEFEIGSSIESRNIVAEAWMCV